MGRTKQKGPGRPVPGKPPTAELERLRFACIDYSVGMPAGGSAGFPTRYLMDLADAAILRAAAEIWEAKIAGPIAQGGIRGRIYGELTFNAIAGAADALAERAGQ